MTLNSKNLEASIRDILKNGRRLLADAEFLEYTEPPTSAMYLTAIAQEEFAKAFLFAISARSIIPWHRTLIRASLNHQCKQLLYIILEYLEPDVDEFIDRCDAVVLHKELPTLPSKVSDSINILRHEKIGRWISNNWCWAEEPEYSKEAQSVMKGAKDKKKQDLLYVRLVKDGSVASKPVCFDVTRLSLTDEMNKAERFASLVERLLDNEEFVSLDWSMVEDGFRAVFSDISMDDSDILR